MFHIIYKIANLIDGKIYIGAHSTTHLDDGYMGSGKYLKRAMKIHGKQNFTKEILFVFDTKDAMFAKEAELVTEEFITTHNTYNLKVGGSGGNPGIIGAFAGKRHTDATKQKLREANLGKTHTLESRLKLSANNYAKTDEGRRRSSERLTGRTCSEEHRMRVSQAILGKVLINDGVVNKRISKEELDFYLSQGWVKGRKKNTSRL
jgi:group I intron endonuclease